MNAVTAQSGYWFLSHNSGESFVRIDPGIAWAERERFTETGPVVLLPVVLDEGGWTAGTEPVRGDTFEVVYDPEFEFTSGWISFDDPIGLSGSVARFVRPLSDEWLAQCVLGRS